MTIIIFIYSFIFKSSKAIQIKFGTVSRYADPNSDKFLRHQGSRLVASHVNLSHILDYLLWGQHSFCFTHWKEMLCFYSMFFCCNPRNKSQDREHRGPGARGRILFDLIIHLKKAWINKIPQSFLGLLEHFVHVKTYGMSYYFLRFILNTSCEYSSTGVVFQKWTLVLVGKAKIQVSLIQNESYCEHFLPRNVKKRNKIYVYTQFYFKSKV